MNIKAGTSILIVLFTGGIMGWAQTTQVIVVTAPATPAVVVTNVISNLEVRSIPTAPLNVTVITNSIPEVPRVDTTELVHQFTGTDAITKQKVATAVLAIRSKDYAVAVENLRVVLARTALSDDQTKALKDVLNQLP